MTKLREAHQQKIEAQIEELNARLAVAKAQAKKLAADAKIAAHEELADTETKLKALKASLGKLRVAGDGAFKDMKGGVESAWTELNAAAKQAMKRFGKAEPAPEPKPKAKARAR